MRRITLLSLLLVVALPATARAGGGGGCGETITEGEPLVVSMTHSCFGPEVIEVGVGDVVTFVNDDPYAHTVTGAGLGWGSVDLMQRAATTDVSFDRPGVYPYMCILHPGMAGAVVVTAGEAQAKTPDVDPISTGAVESASSPHSALPVLAYAGVAAAVLGVVSVRMLRQRSIA